MDRIAELGADIARSHDTDLDDTFHMLTGSRLETKSAKPSGDLDTIAAEIERQGKAIEAAQEAERKAREIGAGRQKLLDLRLKRLEAERAVDDERTQQKRSGRGVDAVTEAKQRRHDEATNRAEELEKRLAAVEEKNRALAAKLARPAGFGGAGKAAKSAPQSEWRAAQLEYLRSGKEIFDGKSLRELEAKAMQTQVDASGGFLIRPEYEQGPIEKLLLNIVPMRQLATVRPVSSMIYKKPFNQRGTGAGWVGETAARPETTTSQLTEMSFPVMEMYAMPGASQVMLQDMPDIEAWLAEEVNDRFAELEGVAFIAGTGINQPRGILSYPTVADTSWTDTNVGFYKTGVNGGFSSTVPGDVFNDVAYACKPVIRANGQWLLNRKTIAAVRKFKDTTGQYLWQQNLQLGEPPTLIGYPTTEAEQMPDMATDSFSIAFGDWKRAYLILDRIGVQVLRDPFTNKPNVMFYTTKRVGGGIQNFESLKLIKFSA